MKICLYPSIIKPMKMGGIKTAFEHKKQALSINEIQYSCHPFIHSFDILHLECPTPQSAFYALWAKKKGKKVVMSIHVTAEDFKETYTFGKRTVTFLQRYLTWYYSLADLLVAPSDYTKKLVRQYGVKKPIKVISNGLHSSFVNNNQHNTRNLQDIPIIGTVGYVTRRKGVITFCNIAKQFPTLDFQWAGAVHDRLLFDTKSIDIPDNVKLLGYVSNIKDLYRSFTVFLFPSYEENQGIVLLEAASFGLPLIIRDLPVYEGWLIHKENCLKCSNEKEFIDHLKSILNDETLREKLGKNARKLAEKNDIAVIGKKLITCYNQVL